MKNSKLVMASVAVAFLAGGIGAASAQGAPDNTLAAKRLRAHGHASRIDENTGYRPLTVGAQRRRVATRGAVRGPAAAVTGIGNGIAAPFNSAAQVGGPVGFGFGVAGAAVGGATTLAAAPLVGLFGGPVGISPDPARPLPIKARYARTGPVAATFDEGYTQEVPVDKSGPIYMIDNEGNNRRVTPFSLAAFPVTAATSVITAPLRPAVPHG